MALAEKARSLAQALPLVLVQRLAEAIASSDLDAWPTCRARMVNSITQPYYRSLTVSFLDHWRARAEHIVPQAAASALITAALAEQSFHELYSVELVWTGPDIGVVPLRRTEQVLLQVIDAACQRLLVVSYAVYYIPHICEALVRAAERGVHITLVIETPDRLTGQHAYDTLKALGPAVATRCSVFLWPREKRQTDANGKPGILHVKCAVADGRWLFVSSANLTAYAFTINMELGLLMRGSALPTQVERHFDGMIHTGLLVRV
jgi:phosphatidylserine/phosphatidylglycerophosphate/cardiolipin synthase-like enzyme